MTAGLVIGLGACAVYFLAATEEGASTIDRTTKAGDRIGEGVADVLDKVHDGVAHVASVAGRSVRRTSATAQSEADKLTGSMSRTAKDVADLLTTKA